MPAQWATAFVYRYCTVWAYKANNFLTRNGIAMMAMTILGFLLLGKIASEETLGLIGDNNILPVLFRLDALVSEDFHYVATMKFCLY